MQSGARPMDVSANTPTASKNSKTTSKACVAPCGHSLVIKKEINTHDSTKVKKPSNNSKVPISIKSTVQTWRGVLKSRDREIASIELIQSKQTNTNPQKKTEEKETRSKKLDNRNVRTDNCQRVHIDNIGPNFTGKTNNELKGSLASAKPIPDLATMLKKISVLNNWLTNSADDYLTTTSANTEVSFQICDKMNKKEPKTVEDIDNPTSSAKDEVVVASLSSSAKVNKTENSVFLHKSRTNANPTKDICKSPEEKSACRLNNEMFNSIRNESGYSSMNPVKVKTSNISENTIVKGPCPSFIIKQDSNLVSDEESKTSETLECISAMTVLLQPTVICNDLKYKLENKNENTSPAANQEIATGDSFTVNGVSKSYQFPSQDVNHDDCTCRIPPSYVDCESEVLQKTTNLESVVFDSSIHNSVSFPTNEAEVMDQLSHFNMLDACPGDEKSFLDDESECHCTTTSSFSHSGPIFANCISGDMTDTWEYRFFDAAGTVAHDHVKNSYAIESSEKSYIRRCGCIHNSTNTRFYMPCGEADYLRHKRNRRICSRHMRCCCHSKQVSLIVQLANQCRRKWSSAVKKTLHRWMVFRKKRFKIGCRRFSDCAISLIQRSMLLQDVDVQTQILYFRETGTVMMKDQKSMAMMTSLRLHSWLASYNKLHTDSQMRRIHKNIKNIQQEYTSRGPFRFPMANTKQFLQFCATTQQIRAAVDGCPGYPLRVFHSSPARHSPRSITCGKQTDEIVQKEVWTMMDYFNQDITTETEDHTFVEAPGCAGFRVHPLKTCCWMDDKECERFNNKSVLDTGYFTVQNIITSPCATGNLRTNFDSKTGLYKPFMSFDGRCCQNVDFSKKISLNVAAKPNFTSSIKSFLKNIRRPNSPVRKGSVNNCTTESGVGRKNSQSTQMSYFLSPSSKSAAISTSEINCRRSIGCTTTSPDVANMTVLTLGNTEVGDIFFNVLKQENASQYSQLNLTEPPKPKLKSTAVNTATEECQNAADIFIISKIKKGTRFEAAKISCKNNNSIYASNISPGTSGYKILEYRTASTDTDISPVLTELFQSFIIAKCIATKATSDSTLKTERATSIDKLLIVMDHAINSKSQVTSDSPFIKEAAAQTDFKLQFNCDKFKPKSLKAFYTRTISQMTSFQVNRKEAGTYVNPEIMVLDYFLIEKESQAISNLDVKVQTARNPKAKQSLTKSHALNLKIRVETATKSKQNSDDEKSIRSSSKTKNNICDLLYSKVDAAPSYTLIPSIDKNHIDAKPDNTITASNVFTQSDNHIHQLSHCTQCVEDDCTYEDQREDISFYSMQCNHDYNHNFISVSPTQQEEEAVPKRTKNATTGPYLVEKVSEALSAIDISSSMIQKCAQVQYSQQSLIDVNMKQVTSVGVMTSTDDKPQFSCHKSKANATVQCNSYPMRKNSSQRSTNIGRSQLMSVFTLCSSNKEVATQYSKSCERLFYEEPHLNDDPKGAAGVVSQKSSVTTSTEDTTKPTVLQAARGENYAFNYPPSMHDGLPQSKPRSLYKALSSDTYSPRNRASFRSSSFDDKREPILDPQLICLSNLNNKDDSTFEAVSSSLNAVKWIRRCGLPLGLPIDNEAYKEEQKELLDHFRKAMQKGSPQSSNSPQVTIEETQAFHQAPLDQLKALLTTMIPRSAPVPPVFNTDSMEVTPPCSQILGKSFTKTEARNKENSREFQLQVKSGNEEKKYSKEFQLQAKPDSCDAATDCIPICSMLEMRNTKSASAITSRVVLPPCSCRDRCAKYDECLFVYDSPKCVTHNRSHTDASLQIYPSSRNVELETSKEHAVDEYIGSNTSITATSYTCCQNIQKDMPPDLLTQRLSNPVELHQFIHENTPREYTVRQNSVYNDPSIEVLRKALELSPKMLKALYETSKVLACSNWSDAAVSTDDGLTYNLSTQMCCPEQLSAGVLTSRFFGNENFNSQETSLTTTTTPTTKLTTPPVKLSCRNTFTQPSCKMAIDGITQCSHSKYSTKALDAYPPEGVEIGCGSTKECSTTDEMHGWCCNMLNHRIGRVKDCLMKQLARHIKDREISDKNLLVMDNTMHSRQPGSRISCLRSGPSCNIMSVRSSLDIGGEDKKDLSHAYNTLSAIEGRIHRLRRNLPD